VRVRLFGFALLIGGLVVTTGAYAADEIKVRPPDEKKNFYRNFLTPQMKQRLNGQEFAATEFANRSSNEWMRDDETVGRVQKGAITATKKALKRYAIQSLGIDKWSLPLFRSARANDGAGEAAGLGGEVQRARLRFGISHLSPRAEVIIPATQGKFAISADTRGMFGATFESPGSDIRFGLTYEASSHAATFVLNRRF
jgi:hypothetical protein